VTAVRSARLRLPFFKTAAIACACDFDVDDDSTWLISARSA
jgi:hypothetical protein